MEKDLSGAFKALGNPHRLRIVRLLLEREWSCCEQDRPEDCRLDPAPEKEGFRMSPAKTGHRLPDDEELPFWHVTFVNVDVESSRGS